MPLDQNFTLIDLRAVALACVLFSLFAFVPGYALGWCTNVFSFRQRLLSTRLLIAVVISVSVFPAFTYWAGMLSVWAIWTVTAVSAVAVVILLVRELRGGIPRPTRVHGRFLLLVAVWVVVAAGSLIDLQMQDRLYFSSTVHDHSVRAPITAAISRAGVRPANPLFFPGAPVPLRYHYLWYIPGSLVDQLGGKTVGPRQALIAGAIWCGIALIALIPLYLRFFDHQGPKSIHRRSLLGVGLLAVTGLDLIPTVALTNFGLGLQADMDSWNEVVASWFSTVLWAPHHVVALIACLTGFLMLWCIEHGSNARTHVVMAACAFASAAGCSVYVTLVFAAFLAVWTLVLLARRCLRDCATLLAAGVLAGILSLPYLLSLVSRGAAAAGSASESLLTLSVRKFFPAEALLAAASPHSVWLNQLVYAALLPLNYFLELGFFFVIGWLTLKKYATPSKLTRQQLALCTMLITSVVICTFVSSSVIANNDLGWRGFLFAQFVLILWSVDFWPVWPKLTFDARIALRIMLVIGAYGVAYQVIMLRVYPMLQDVWAVPETAGSKKSPPSAYDQLGRRTLAMRRAYDRLDSMLPEDATIQFNPKVGYAGRYFCGLYANRQIVAFDEGCGSVFGGMGQDCAGLISRISPMFESPHSPRPSDLDPIDVLVFQDTDPVWADRRSWIWHVQPLIANEFFRAVPASAISSHRAARVHIESR